MSTFTPLSDELHEYIVAHGTRQADVLRRVLGAGEAIELGTFTGYSAICIARGLEPGGRLIACELSEEYAEIAARNFEAAGVADRIEIRIGPAADTLRDLPERELFDFAFIDADKTGWRPGTYSRTERTPTSSLAIRSPRSGG